ncbi:maltokinase N-terminal cap-like domain-containing protein [Microbacterium rhizomatis]|uniref:Maltokinase n=1 Tax=Microbacterium rhizomatis TaxID=1631477 RepID=A0A5J5J5A4_9MICO|nr:phosphotransferase [Microbacterium rhizomatis]KAA9110284.1 aminoglycoside phosphotransferase [Microbacterium rhizomatis]
MDSTLACLAAWMPRQRWYAAKGRTPNLRFIASWDLPGDDARVRVRTLLVADEVSLPPVLYQVPVVARATAAVADAVGVIGSPEPGTTLIDGPTDLAYTDALRELVTVGGHGRGFRTIAVGRPAPSAPPTGSAYTARVLSGEQSNTSLIYLPDGDGTAIICKIFRQIHAGLNPEIELQTALAASGSPFVPRAIGSVDGEWPDPASASGAVRGSLAFAQEFFSGVEDAWRVALRAADVGEDFADRAREMGIATARVHLDLAALFPTVAPLPADREAIAAVWRRRLSTAIAEVPALAPHRDDISAAYDRAVGSVWPVLQRVHGDYHLGQVILVPGRGWVLLDFEGEPLRPMSERVRPDIALRDVAGMLRSFDYVAGSIRLDQPDRSPVAAREWASSARSAFLDGYAAASGLDLGDSMALLEALELDKAVYEATYEARNRPTWVPIPLQAVQRLLGTGSSPTVSSSAAEGHTR